MYLPKELYDGPTCFLSTVTTRLDLLFLLPCQAQYPEKGEIELSSDDLRLVLRVERNQ